MTSSDSLITYTRGVDGVAASDLDGFFVGWPSPPSADRLLRVLANSHLVVVARDLGTVVGFVNALTDGELAAYIPLLEVRPSHQGRGIGTILVQSVIDALADIYMLDVVCDAAVVPFYERFGMTRLNGMARRNREAPILTAGM